MSIRREIPSGSSGSSRVNDIASTRNNGADCARKVDMNQAWTCNRRQLLESAACGFGAMALAGLAGESSATASPHPLAARTGHHAPRAKRVIFIFLQGGPSHVDTFDHKPRLDRDDGREVEIEGYRFDDLGQATKRRMMKSPWSFRPYGECGHLASELFPHVGALADDLCFLHGMHTEGVAHGPAVLFLHTGANNFVRPSVGSWVTYGLGTESADLPAFVTICPTPKVGGPQNYGAAFLPPVFQGTALGRAGAPSSRATIRHLRNETLPAELQAAQFDFLQRLNRAQADQKRDDPQLESVIQSYETAFRMQSAAPAAIDLSRETAATRDMYGLDDEQTADFGRQCLLARRLAESGVRYIQISHADATDTGKWDQHNNLKQHAKNALAVDRPIAALLRDLKQRGLLDDTLVWCGGEFGRTPFAQGKDGRDHNSKGFTMWLAGAGVRPGFSYGATDEHGYLAVEGRVHMHDLHATILHLLGLDHERLTYRYAGRDFRLTDVYGNVVREVLA